MSMNHFDVMKLAVESALPNNTVLLDNVGMPSIMVRVPKFYIKDVFEGYTGAATDVFPAFLVDTPSGQQKELDEIYISKFPNVVVGDRAYSLPGRDPKTPVNFDQAVTYCKNKGEGWHLMSNAEWMGLVLWCKKHGTIPRGNTNCGKSDVAPHETGIASYTYTEGGNVIIGRTLTGSGPATWSHDHTPAGIYDLCGNVWEWVSGFRLSEGEIQIIPKNNAARNPDMSASSSEWMAILASDGSLVPPGTEGTLHYDSPTPGTAEQRDYRYASDLELNNKRVHPFYTGDSSTNPDYASNSRTFETLGKNAAIEQVPDIAKVLGFYPTDATTGEDNDDAILCRNYGERLPIRGGSWGSDYRAGVDAMRLTYSRIHADAGNGFRSAFAKLPTD